MPDKHKNIRSNTHASSVKVASKKLEINKPYAVAVNADIVSVIPIWAYNINPALKPAHIYKIVNPLNARKIHIGMELNNSAT